MTSSQVDESVQQSYEDCDFNSTDNMYTSKWYSGEIGGDSLGYNTVDSFVDDMFSIMNTYTLNCQTTATQVNSEIYDNCTVNGGSIEQVAIVDVDTNCVSGMNTDASTQAVIEQTIQSYAENIQDYAADADDAVNQMYNIAYNIQLNYTTDCSTEVMQSNQIVCDDSSGTIGSVQQCSYFSGMMNCLQTNQDFVTLYRNMYYSIYGSWPPTKPTPDNVDDYKLDNPDDSDNDDLTIIIVTSICIAIFLILICIAIFASKNVKILKSKYFHLIWISLLLMCIFIPGISALYWPFQDNDDIDTSQYETNQTNYLIFFCILSTCLTLFSLGFGNCLYLHHKFEEEEIEKAKSFEAKSYEDIEKEFENYNL